MESCTLYGTGAWWRMKEHDDRNDPKGPAKAGEGEEAPRAAFAPPVTNPSVLSILNGLNPSVTPVPMAIATTDGEMAASYAAGPRRAPIAEETPAPQASVVVRESTPPGKKKAPSPDRVDTTFRIRPRKMSLAVQIAVGVVVGGILVAAWLGRTTSARSPSPTPSATSVRVVPPLPPPAPAPAPEPTTASPEPTTADPAVTAVAPPTTSVRSVPASPSAAHPTKEPRRSDVYRAPF